MNPFVRRILYGVMGLLSTMLPTCFANLTFTNPATKLLINPSNSKVFIGNASKVTGWSQRSVVQNFGNNASTGWLEAYANGTVVGRRGQAGVTAPARTTLVDANSNAICQMDLAPLTLRTTSNALLFMARTYSSSLFVLRSREDINTISARTTSNAVFGFCSFRSRK